MPWARSALLLLLWTPAAVLAQPTPLGSELQVNAATSQDQKFSAIAVDTAAGFVVVWESYEQDGSYEGIFARRFDASGEPVGIDFQVSSHTVEAQRYPAVANDDDGDFVVVWESDGQDSSGTGIFAQRFDSAGTALGGEFQVNASTDGAQSAPAVAMTGGGSFVVVWASYQQDSFYYGIFGQRFDSAGMPLGTEFQVNTDTTSGKYYPAAAMDGAGGFVVVWDSYQDGSYYGIFGQRFDSAGMPQGTELQVNSMTEDTQTSPAVAATGNGFVVVWQSYGQGIFGQLLDADGMPLGSEFQVNSSTSGYPYPAVAAGGTGDFVVVWASYDQNPLDRDVSGRHFDPTGMPLGGDFQINTTTAMPQNLPALAMSGGGDLVVVWQSQGQDGSGYGVFGQRFAAAPAASIDVDGNGLVEPLTDALLILRHHFGFTDAALTNAAVGADCSRCDGTSITNYLTALGLVLDIDNDGALDPLTDGLLVLRFLFGFTGTTLTNGAVAGDCVTRCDAATILPYLQTLD